MGMSDHTNPIALKNEWITPKHITDELGYFELDPCAPINPPWKIADKTFNIIDDGLKQDWEGRVWCNPPYGLEAKKWLNRLADHGSGIALVFARTETDMFFGEVWPKACAVLFIKGRLYFHHVDGTRAKSNSGAPSVLIAYSYEDAKVLRDCGIEGKYFHM